MKIENSTINRLNFCGANIEWMFVAIAIVLSGCAQPVQPNANVRAGAGGSSTGSTGSGSGGTSFHANSQCSTLNQDVSGFTHFAPSADTQIVYVSSSVGADTNSGLSPKSAVKTIARGMKLLRNHHPDWLLLKKGDTWNGETFNDPTGSWKYSGESASAPMLVSSYTDCRFPSSDRPVINTSNTALHAFGTLSNVAISGLYFHANTRDPYSPDYAYPKSCSDSVDPATGDKIQICTGLCTTLTDFTNPKKSKTLSCVGAPYGIYWATPSQNILVEDSVFDSFGTNVTFDGGEGRQVPVQNIRLVRNIFKNAFGDGRAQGIYMGGLDGLTVQENIFYHNGWTERTDLTNTWNFMPQNHNAYLRSDSVNITVTGNIFIDGANEGIEARSGGNIDDNLFMGNGSHMTFGLVNGASAAPGGVTGEVANNVILGGRAGGSMGIEIGNIKSASIHDNIIAHDTPDPRHWYAAINLEVGNGMSNPQNAVGVNHLTIENNIVYDWARAVMVEGDFIPGSCQGVSSCSPFRQLNQVSVQNNEFQDLQGIRVTNHLSKFDPSFESFGLNQYQIVNSNQSLWFNLQSSQGLNPWMSTAEPTSSIGTVFYPNIAATTIEAYDSSLGGDGTRAHFIAGLLGQSRDNWSDAYTAHSANSYIRAGFGR